MVLDGTSPRSDPDPGWSPETITLLASLACTLGYNHKFWAALTGLLPASGWSALRVVGHTGVAIIGLHWLLLLLVVNRFTARPVLVLLAFSTASAIYFMETYGIVIDRAMMLSVLDSDLTESGEYLDWRLALYLLGYGALPAWLAWRVPIRATGGWSALGRRGSCMAAALGLMLAGAWPVLDVLVPAMREHAELRYLVTPANYLIATARALVARPEALEDKGRPRLPVAADAHRDSDRRPRRPLVFVLVIGETVRAANWGLDGYARQTTPELAARQAIPFLDVTSCGTDTNTSLPCMFSAFGRRAYDEWKIRESESALHVVARAGVEVLWRDNQMGCKGTCDGLRFEDLTADSDPELCDGVRCFDEVLLRGLSERIAAASGDLLVVLHMLGNHGPAYYQRYPQAYRRWTPTCDTTSLVNCSREALVNTYDNAILYTDHLLGQLIDMLAGLADRDAGMLYVSDHGESLGEHGLYLHGMPYQLAPPEQVRVPMALWFPDRLGERLRLDRACLEALASERPVSHDWLFNTLLGLFEVSTSTYEPGLDLVAACRGAERLPIGPSPGR